MHRVRLSDSVLLGSLHHYATEIRFLDMDRWRQWLCPKSHTLLIRYVFWTSNYLATANIYIYIYMCVVIIMWLTSIICKGLMPITYLPQGPRVILKCPSHAHFRISPEVVGHAGTFYILLSDKRGMSIFRVYVTLDYKTKLHVALVYL